MVMISSGLLGRFKPQVRQVIHFISLLHKQNVLQYTSIHKLSAWILSCDKHSQPKPESTERAGSRPKSSSWEKNKYSVCAGP